ncbi:hypothetical protein ACFL6S_26870 [Candidatus Poribacteria bacterium]
MKLHKHTLGKRYTDMVPDCKKPEIDEGGRGMGNAEAQEPKEVKIEMSDESLLSLLQPHIEIVKRKIIKEAGALAEEEKRPVEPMDITDACKRYAPGTRIPEEKEMSFWGRMGASISGITLISGILAVVFGVIAITGQGGGAELWVDVVKILVGAIVGSTGATTAAALKRK